MKRYALFKQRGRFVIDETALPVGEDVVDARFWIEAKRRFGFELTPLQVDIFNRKVAAEMAK